MNLVHIWRAALTQQLLGLAGFSMIVIGYALILNHSGTDFDVQIRRAVDGMGLVIAGGVIEIVVLLIWAGK